MQCRTLPENLLHWRYSVSAGETGLVEERSVQSSKVTVIGRNVFINRKDVRTGGAGRSGSAETTVTWLGRTNTP